MLERPVSTNSFAHGAAELPSVVVNGYGLEFKEKGKYAGERANRRAFFDALTDLSRLAPAPDSAFTQKRAPAFSKRELERILAKGVPADAAVVLGAIEVFSESLASVIARFLKHKSWAGAERIIVGGGLSHGRLGALVTHRTKLLLHAQKIAVDLVPIRYHPDEAALIGAGHLMPSWVLDGHDAMIAIDIGGTNIRVGVVRLRLDQAPDLSRAAVWKSTVWRHADESPARQKTVDRMVRMVKRLAGLAAREGFKVAPLIGVGCPGVITHDGSIDRGGQNLPGGNWESERFNLAAALAKGFPHIGEHQTSVIIHNDAVVQGLSEVPFCRDTKRWAVVTIGTGLGNASFDNRAKP
ncbi:ROK family protein [Kaistia soli DSM 19436]|uniref:ROK family protein n=1 Tax=Kaistia soli DSM 19436 TaxID=1122133 RepID=A0A1M5I898_9HYPH|nr:ROK family protein [Kaistia soli]SHG24461.1 ROK family protein [Kaistia soli DSM 19436]